MHLISLSLLPGYTLDEVQVSTVDGFSRKIQEEIMFEPLQLYSGTDLGQN